MNKIQRAITNIGITLRYSMTIITLLSCEAQHAQSVAEGQFILEGRIEGGYSGYVYLNYLPGDGKLGIMDSSKVKNGVFLFEGYISEPTEAIFSTFNLQNPVYVYDKNNITKFYIDPARMTLSAIINQLNDLRLTGSITDNDRIHLEELKGSISKIVRPLEDSFALYLKERRKLSDSIQQNGLTFRIDSLYKLLKILYQKSTTIDSEFIVKNPNSFVAAYMLSNSRYEDIAFPSLEALYSKFPEKIRESTPGRKIQAEIEKDKRVIIGNNAYNFIALTNKGDTINLNMFKGNKYVLLDFWASWCAPCRRITPLLKKWNNKHINDFQIISISFQDKEVDWLKAIGEDNMDWPQILGDKSISTLEPNDKSIPELYYINLLPSLILIDKNSKIIAKFGGWYDSKSVNLLNQELSIVLKR